jgi:hypothetical protein
LSPLWRKPFRVAWGNSCSVSRTDHLLCDIRLSACNDTAHKGKISVKCLCFWSLWKLSTHSYFSEYKSDKTADNLHEDLLKFIISSRYWSL